MCICAYVCVCVSIYIYICVWCVCVLLVVLLFIFFLQDLQRTLSELRSNTSRTHSTISRTQSLDRTGSHVCSHSLIHSFTHSLHLILLGNSNNTLFFTCEFGTGQISVFGITLNYWIWMYRIKGVYGFGISTIGISGYRDVGACMGWALLVPSTFLPW